MKLGRRDFLKGLAAIAGTAAVGVASEKLVVEEAKAASVVESPVEEVVLSESWGTVSIDGVEYKLRGAKIERHVEPVISVDPSSQWAYYRNHGWTITADISGPFEGSAGSCLAEFSADGIDYSVNGYIESWDMSISSMNRIMSQVVIRGNEALVRA